MVYHVQNFDPKNEKGQYLIDKYFEKNPGSLVRDFFLHSMAERENALCFSMKITVIWNRLTD
jgi:hypothetical protein